MRMFFKWKPYWFLLLVQILFVQHSYAQQSLSDSLFKRFRNDVKDEMLFNNGWVVWDVETDESYCLLMSSLPIEHLIKYTNDSIAALRARIFVGLAKKGADDSLLKEILNNHKDDTAVFIDAATDAVHSWTVNEYMKFVYVNIESFGRFDFKARLDRLREEQKGLHIILPGVRHGLISKKDLLNIDSLVCSEEGFQILAFELYTKKKRLSVNKIISKPIKRLLRELKSQDWIYIEEIKCLFPDKTIMRLNSLLLKIR